jgi:translation initiation factor 2 beta subunit (eIF-2beta)/eIF-5
MNGGNNQGGVNQQWIFSRHGTTKTLFVNFTSVCDAENVNPRRVANLIALELRTFSKIDIEGRLVLKGRFMSADISDAARRVFVSLR